MENSYYIVLKHKCRSWFCPDCKRSRAVIVRTKLREKISLFSVPRLLTFTVDPKLFSTPKQAYEYVRDKKFIPIMMRYLGIKNWFCVTEFQRIGYPHWHLLVDIASLPGAWCHTNETGKKVFSSCKPDGERDVFYIEHFLDLKRIHILWRRWKIGEQVDLSYKKVHADSLKAINYITKYLFKNPIGGYPDWVLDSDRIRMISASRSVGGFFNDGVKQDDDFKQDDDLEDDITDVDDVGYVRCVRQRVGECGLSTICLKYRNGYLYGATYLDVPYKAIMSMYKDNVVQVSYVTKNGHEIKLSAIDKGLYDKLEDFSFQTGLDDDKKFWLYSSRCKILGFSLEVPF